MQEDPAHDGADPRGGQELPVRSARWSAANGRAAKNTRAVKNTMDEQRAQDGGSSLWWSVVAGVTPP
jgi:hypothetical protein